MTKVTILGQEPTEEKKLKPIEFVYWFDNAIKELNINHTNFHPSQYENIELITVGVSANEYDIMFAYDNGKRSSGVIYLGHFNDGVVE